MAKKKEEMVNLGGGKPKTPGAQINPKATTTPNLGGGVSNAKADKAAPDTKISEKSSKHDILKAYNELKGKQKSGAKLKAETDQALIPSKIHLNESKAFESQAKGEAAIINANAKKNYEERQDKKDKAKISKGRKMIFTLAKKNPRYVTREEFRDYAAANRYLGTDPKSMAAAANKAAMAKNKAIGRGLGVIGSFIRGLRQGH